jgi:hypothetical protein
MESVLDMIMGFLMSVEGSAATIAIVLEVVLRLIPSDKPRSIILLVAGVCKKVGDILVKASEILNKVVPQKLKQ